MPATPGSQTHGVFTIPSLDGLRAIAVLTVFVGHGAVGISTGFWPGHVGVTIFFFLSGFLITTLLRREYGKTGTLSLSKFYLRRALRILPPAYLAIAAAVVFGALGLVAADTTGWGVLAEVLNYTNYYIVIAGREGLPPDTTQFWSLAVEEHYYLIVPIVLLVLFKSRATLKTIGWTMIGIALVVPVWRIVLGLTGASFDRLYISTDTRIDSLIFGTAMALLFNPAMGDRFIGPTRISLWLTRHIGLVAAIATVVFVASALVPSQAFRLSIADTIQCVCLIPIFWFVITRPSSLVGRVLNSRVVVQLGILSFSIYLFHRLVLNLVENVITQPLVGDLVALIGTLVVAQIVYVVIEKPAGRLRKRLEVRINR
ncbi:acyltransferase family protein [Herbiconiux daphne]|uniref:Acyltransferase n=1 Tax=Herbiconiux daphne TaxID=2970914 RepID=A0ABT2H6L6_9MICO|nr:acyltransferase [Herbiconiux daphne]MCS5735583.1 acyltransferase [Herbiconiux daphne]